MLLNSLMLYDAVLNKLPPPTHTHTLENWICHVEMYLFPSFISRIHLHIHSFHRHLKKISVVSVEMKYSVMENILKLIYQS